MSLKEQIGEDIKTAMKAKDKIRLQTVRGIKKAILDKEVELRPQGKDCSFCRTRNRTAVATGKAAP